MWRCPTCGDTELEVVVEVWAKLTQTDEENFGTDVTEGEMGGDHEWSSSSPMACVNSECADYMDVKAVKDFEDVPAPKKCDKCQLIRINGTVCHEIGCPNMGAKWEERDGDWQWVKYYECRECGCDVIVGESCDCNEPMEEDDAS